MADCYNTPGSFVCKCKPNYAGDGITKCNPLNLCLDPKTNPCNTATTVCKFNENTAATYCECLRGFELIPNNQKDCAGINSHLILWWH